MTEKPKLVFSRPADKSLEAYKEWIQGTAKALGLKNGKENSLSGDEWVIAWKEFWSK